MRCVLRKVGKTVVVGQGETKVVIHVVSARDGQTCLAIGTPTMEPVRKLEDFKKMYPQDVVNFDTL